MKRSLALGALMAFVITGSAMASVINYGDSFTNQNGNGEYANVSDGAFIKTDTTIGDKDSVINFKSKIGNGDFAGINYNALVVAGNNVNANIEADEIYIGSKDQGGDRGFRVTGGKNGSNVLTIHANKFISYAGDETVHARQGANTINLGTEDRYIGYFEAHTTFGKDDYGVAILQANEGSIVNLYADKAILDGSTNVAGGVIGTGGWGTVNVTANDLTIDGNICGSYGLMNNTGKEAVMNVNAVTLNMTGDVNVGSSGNGSSNFSRDTKVNITVAGQATIKGDINVLGNSGSKANEKDNSVLNITFNGDSVIDGDINVKGSDKNINATVNLGGTGDMSASKGVYNVEKSGNVNFTGGNWVVNEWNSQDESGNVSVAGGANVNVAGNMAVQSFDLDGSTTLKGENVSIKTNTLTGDKGVVNTDSLTNKIEATNTAGLSGLTVNGSGAIADQIAADKDKANDLANVVVSGDKTAANKVTTDEGVIGGRFEADVVVGKMAPLLWIMLLKLKILPTLQFLKWAVLL